MDRITSLCRTSPITAALLFVFLTLPAAGVAQDQLVFTGGLTLQGEVKELSRGTLDFDTEEMDVVAADWDLVDAVSSAGQYEVTTVAGEVHFGSLSGSGRSLLVSGPEGTATLAFDDVVEIIAISQGFIARTSGFLDLTANLARANDLFSLLGRARGAYSGRRYAASVQVEQYVQNQTVTDTAGLPIRRRTSRYQFTSGLKRYFGGRFAATLAQQLEGNDELSLEQRSLTTLGLEYNVIRNQVMELRVGAGGVLNSEHYTGVDRTESGELNLSAGFDAFDIGDVDIYTSVNSYTNPSDGRVRVDVDGRVQWEVFSDFFIGLNVTERFDSEPPAGALDRDFQYGFSVGWSWS